jgi:FMN phosphatase YigB (HAD superfamily)
MGTQTENFRSLKLLIYVTDNNRHLICLPYTIPNMHIMAQELGIKRCWFHRTHYDIPKRRTEEIGRQCLLVSSREIVTLIGRKL